MADTAGQQDIRGIDVQRFVTGFADEDSVLKGMCRNSPTSAREIRWFQKTAGFISPTTTSGITSNLLANTASRAIAPVTQQTFTRNTSYVRKYFTESELISIEDEKDTDVDILATMIRDLLRSVANQVDVRIYNVLTESLSPSNINTAAAAGTGWDDATNGNPIGDLLTGLSNLRSNSYTTNGAILYIHPTEHKNLMDYLINVKGSSIPEFSSEQVRTDSVMTILGMNVVVSTNATTDYALIFLRGVSAAWKAFTPLTSAVVTDEGVGKKIRVWEEGECLLENPKSVHLITDTVT